ncbi:MAG: CvpA family protein [Emergencia sp.]
MDIIVILILLLSAILGARKGCALTIASFMQWFVCIITGFIFADEVKVFLMDNTMLDDMIHSAVLQHIETTIEESSPYQAVPALFSTWVNEEGHDFAYGTAASITGVIMTVVSFLVIIFALKVIAFLIVHLFSRRYNEGVTGFFDGLLGFALGLVRGVLLVLLFFAFLVPVLGTVWPSFSETVVEAMDKSYVAGLIYDDNVLLILLRDLFS